MIIEEEFNMKTLYNVYEGLLAGMGDTLNAGDQLFTKACSELSSIKTYADHSNHKLWNKRRFGYEGYEYRASFDVKNLAAVLGYDSTIDVLSFTITKDDGWNEWVILLVFCNDYYRTTNRDNWQHAKYKISIDKVKTFPALLKKYVDPIFKDIDSLKKFMKEYKY